MAPRSPRSPNGNNAPNPNEKALNFGRVPIPIWQAFHDESELLTAASADGTKVTMRTLIIRYGLELQEKHKKRALRAVEKPLRKTG